jgi:hypothetical protein
MTSLQQLVKTGGRLIKHARYYWLLLAEESPDAKAVWRHAGQGGGAAATSGIGSSTQRYTFGDAEETQASVSEIRPENPKLWLVALPNWDRTR